MASYPAEHWSNDPDPASALQKASALDNAFNEAKWRQLFSLIPRDLTGFRVLDYGCGMGFIARTCAKQGALVTGVDQSECALNTARFVAARDAVLERCEFVLSDQVVVRGGGYDLIICKDVIEHMADDDAWMSAASEALVPGGRLICTTQNQLSLVFLIEGSYQRLWRGNTEWMGWDPTHLRFYTAGSLRRLVRRHGLKVKAWHSMYIIPYDIITWLTLFRLNVQINSLRYFDYLFGQVFPFNRLGFGLAVLAEKV
jgi:2-polyprenyl-6-hydroxyphenyl methylase/3-demethylubiquinone-9 3-methyltransferase